MLPRFSLRQLTYFVAIAECGTLSAAAKKLFVSESTVASALDGLERDYGVQFCLRRRAHGVAMTPAGRQFADQARELLAKTWELDAELRAAAGELRGPVIIGSTPGIAPSVLPELMARCSNAYAGVDLRFEIGVKEDLLEMLWRGEIDLVVLVGPKVPEDLDLCMLLPWRVQAILPTAHLLAEQESVLLQELSAEPMILLDAEESTEYTMELFRKATGAEPHVIYRTPSFELVRSLVARGWGYSLQIQRPAGDVTYEGFPLAVREIRPDVKTEAVSLAWPRGMKLTPQAHAVTQLAPLSSTPREIG